MGALSLFIDNKTQRGVNNYDEHRETNQRLEY